MISFISSFKIISVFCIDKSEERVPDPRNFISIAVSVLDAAVGNPNGIKAIMV